jgi:hypothetical protein
VWLSSIEVDALGKDEGKKPPGERNRELWNRQGGGGVGSGTWRAGEFPANRASSCFEQARTEIFGGRGGMFGDCPGGEV